ncbi:MAG: glycosyltransferase family 9 protein, partial [candidate division Zixibacteria bacterium]|nr:glycosyltransferase family 9 protein [candidate division Zixibacteria bacterium]
MTRILVIRLGAIGDLILTSPAIINLRLSNPDAKIFFLTRPPHSQLLKFCPGIDEIIEFPQDSSLFTLFKIGEYLDKIGFDKVIDLHGNFRSKYLMRHISAPVKIQYRKRRWERL